MSYNDLFSKCSKVDWAKHVAQVHEVGGLPAHDGAALSAALVEMQRALKLSRTGRAQSISRGLILIDQARFVREARRVGVFRASKYSFQYKSILGLLASLVGDSEILLLEPTTMGYFESVRSLLSLASQVLVIRMNLARELRNRKMFVLKSLLAILDQTFRPLGGKEVSKNTKTEETDDATHCSSEELAEAFSLILTLFHEVVRSASESYIVHTDEVGILDGRYMKMLVSAVRIRAYIDAEALLDAFPFSATSTPNGVDLAAIDVNLEKSIRLGYIQTDLQTQVRTVYTQQIKSTHNRPRLREKAREFLRLHGNNFISLKSDPIERYVMMLPLTTHMLQFFSQDCLFIEEAAYVESLRAEFYADAKIMLGAEISSGVTVLHFVKLQRLFTFMAEVFLSFLETIHVGGQESLAIRSRVPVFPYNLLLRFVGEIVGPDVAKKILKLLIYEPTDAGYFDIQYQPLIRVGDYVSIPLGVLTTSNIVRNTLCRTHTRILPENGSDPMQDTLATLLERRGFFVKTGVKRKVTGRPLEIDILAYGDGKLLIWECKNAFHPCNAQEMRTSYDHINKAANQLDRSKIWLSDLEVQATLFRELGWASSPTQAISSCIVTANRVFSGYQIGVHPVRQAFEISNVLGDGCIRMHDGDRRLWKGPFFHFDDLHAYIAGETTLRDFHEAMFEHRRSYQIEKMKLDFITYAVDMNHVHRLVVDRYPLLDAT